jgi:hypothetical protein
MAILRAIHRQSAGFDRRPHEESMEKALDDDHLGEQAYPGSCRRRPAIDIHALGLVIRVQVSRLFGKYPVTFRPPGICFFLALKRLNFGQNRRLLDVSSDEERFRLLDNCGEMQL